MAEPKLQIDQRLDRIEKAITILAEYMHPNVSDEIDRFFKNENEVNDG